MSCEHGYFEQVWVKDPYAWDPDNPMELDGDWEQHWVSTTIDIDLHRYTCSQCNEIMYYSGAAREYHEDGIVSNINGLDGKS